MKYSIEEAQAALGNLADPALKPSEYEFGRAVVLVASVARLTISSAESMTGGLIAELLTSVPGASAVFRGGAVTYATDTKSSVLGVSETLLSKGGPVQAEVALAMAAGAARVFASDLGLGVTGVAGPEAQDGVAVGTVHVAVVDSSTQSSRVHTLKLEGTRDEIRVQAATAVLGMLLDVLVSKTDLVRP